MEPVGEKRHRGEVKGWPLMETWGWEKIGRRGRWLERWIREEEAGMRSDHGEMSIGQHQLNRRDFSLSFFFPNSTLLRTCRSFVMAAC
jgi:hypothetical protein